MKPIWIAAAGLLLLNMRAAAQHAEPVRISGTQCRIPAPAGFIASKSFSGYQNESNGAFIMVNEIPAAPAQVSAGFSQDAMKRGGMTLIATEQIKVRDLPASLYKISQRSNGSVYTKYLLLFGQGKSTTLVTAGYPEGANVNPDSLKATILKIECDTALSVDQLEAAAFTLNTEGTDFKPVKFSGGSLLYSMDGKIPTDKPVLIVGSSHGKTPIASQKEFAESRLKKLPGAEKATIRGTAAVTIDGLSGFEVIADGSGKDGQAALVYEVVLYTPEGGYFIIVGQAVERSDGLIETCRRIAKSFKRK